MNKAIIMGRLTRDPEIRWTQAGNSQEQMCIARYTLAVDRRQKDAGADFIPVVAFGKAGEFAEKYFKKGTKLVVTGRIQTGSYTNKEGAKVYTTEIVAEDQEFAESKAASNENSGFVPADNRPSPSAAAGDGFMNIPDGIDEELPFN